MGQIQIVSVQPVWQVLTELCDCQLGCLGLHPLQESVLAETVLPAHIQYLAQISRTVELVRMGLKHGLGAVVQNAMQQRANASDAIEIAERS
jgi:hypothetical protein